ncbi:MAG: PIN domain-containing protein [Actinomycetota bacterium]|nr:PIN domain-containing protein [Actinomycetota bacterium]
MAARIDRVFVDTSAWIAFLDAGDDAHKAVAAGFSGAVRRARLLTTDYVIFETLTYLNCSLKNHDLAVAFYENCQDTVGLEIIPVPSEAAEAALAEFFFKFSDQAISVVDAVSFYIMKQLGLKYALAVGKHFIAAGFELVGRES